MENGEWRLKTEGCFALLLIVGSIDDLLINGYLTVLSIGNALSFY